MAYEDYIKAQKMAHKEFKSATAKGKYPYLPVLDEILSHVDIESEVNLGVQSIPLSHVVGTSTFGRTQAFASNFMPLLDYGTEFSNKWSCLVDAQIKEGIHDAVKVYEYMNRYYVIEGNKRVSVLKYFDAPTIAADVIRKVPKKTDDIENKIYYEYMDFYRLTRINFVQFSKLGSYPALLIATGKNETDSWTDDERMDFSSFYNTFNKAFSEKGGNKLDNVTCSDALLFYLSLYPYADSKNMGKSQIKTNLDSIWSEITLLGKDESIEISMSPKEEKSTVNSVLNSILPSKKKKVAFIYDKDPSVSNWIYSHELGRTHVEEALGSSVETKAFITEDVDVKAEELLSSICEEGYDILFTVTPNLIKPSIKVATAFPNIKVLNCALNSPHNSVRTYYTRMYEAKFLTGMIAGALCENDKIGYIADYPIFGSTANINAFALGAKMVNPRAMVYLAWACTKDFDSNTYFKENSVTYISGQDMITPQYENRPFGLYTDSDEDDTKNLATSIYHWGKFYEAIISSVIDGTWKADDSKNNKAINYWWGFSAGVIDVITSNALPIGTTKLINLIKDSISSGSFNLFSGPIYDQDNNLRCENNSFLKPEEIMTMDWLAINVIGSIPGIDELVDSAKSIVQLRGLKTAVPEKGGTSLI